MSDVLTLHLTHEAVEFLQHRAHAEDRSLDSVVEDVLLREKAFEEESRRPVAFATSDELAGRSAELRDDGETDAEFARRCQSFAALLSLS